jgi:aspartyl-tRNA synthetase
VTHNCGSLTVENLGQSVELRGWLSSCRDVGKTLQFLALRDGHGITQVVANITMEMKHQWENLHGFTSIPLESVISITGVVRRRPLDQINLNMVTGEIEVFIVKYLDMNN